MKEIIIFKHILFTSYKVWSKCPNLAVCNLCKATVQRIDGNTSHMNGHIDRKHPEVTAKKRELKAQAQLDEKKGLKNTVQTSILGHMQPFPDFQDKLLNWVVSTYQPFDVVTEDSFREMVGSISNNKAPIIGKDTIRNLVHDKVACAKLLLKKQLVGQSYSITNDGWTSISNQSYVAVTVHWINDNWKVMSVPLGIYIKEGRSTAKDQMIKNTKGL